MPMSCKKEDDRGSEIFLIKGGFYQICKKSSSWRFLVPEKLLHVRQRGHLPRNSGHEAASGELKPSSVEL